VKTDDRDTSEISREYDHIRKAASKHASPRKKPHKKHRNREEMIADILEAARNSATKTRIMRTCFISYNVLQKYLRYSVENGLLFFDSSSKMFCVTSKGIQFLDYFEQCLDTESELQNKKRLIYRILEENREESVAAAVYNFSKIQGRGEEVIPTQYYSSSTFLR
jgi:predicted transcriptional regulator